MSKFLLVLAFIFSAFCSMLVIAFFFELTKTNTDTGIDVSIIIFFSICDAGTIFYIIKNLSSKKKIEKEKLEKTIINLIISKEGKITPLEIVAETNLNLEESKKILTDLCNQGAGEQRITEDGKVLYVFTSVLTNEQKNNTKGVFDNLN
jgi:predicted transcriptional regulator